MTCIRAHDNASNHISHAFDSLPDPRACMHTHSTHALNTYALTQHTACTHDWYTLCTRMQRTQLAHPTHTPHTRLTHMTYKQTHTKTTQLTRVSAVGCAFGRNSVFIPWSSTPGTTQAQTPFWHTQTTPSGGQTSMWSSDSNLWVVRNDVSQFRLPWRILRHNAQTAHRVCVELI